MISLNPNHDAYKGLVALHAMCSGIMVTINSETWVYDNTIDRFGLIYVTNNQPYIYYPSFELNSFFELCKSLTDEYIAEILAKLALKTII